MPFTIVIRPANLSRWTGLAKKEDGDEGVLYLSRTALSAALVACKQNSTSKALREPAVHQLADEERATTPTPFSLWGPLKDGPPADYISWTGLVDRAYTGRHLPPARKSYMDSLPPKEQVAALFQRDALMTPCPKSSALFGFFAQWFTDSFLRTDPLDSRENTSNHEVDLCQIYGLNAIDTSILRSHKGRGTENRTRR